MILSVSLSRSLLVVLTSYSKNMKTMDSVCIQLFRFTIILGVLVTLLGNTACTNRSEKPNIVFIVLDTVRRDFTGLGESKDSMKSQTPQLDKLAAEGTSFMNAWANAPWTVPSHASMFTGLLPSEHGCTSRDLRLDPEVPTFAELLGNAGYQTVGFFGNPLLHDQVTGMMRGFQSQYLGFKIDEPIMEIGKQGGFKTIRNIRQWFAQRSDSRPFLIFVNFLEPHLPYDPPEAYRKRYLPDLELHDTVSVEWGHQFNAGLFPADQVDWERVWRLYGGDVSTADHLLGEVAHLLKKYHLLEDTVIIITSDHGENLGEHGLIEHQFCIYETLLAVPLIIHAPGLLPRGMRDDPVMLTDLFVTILDIARVQVESLPAYSRSLLTTPAAASRPLIAEYAGVTRSHLDYLLQLNQDLDADRLGATYSTVRVGDLRLTVGSDGSEMLHDLSVDPGQNVNRAYEYPQEIEDLYKFFTWPQPTPNETRQIKIDEDLKTQIRSLGYVQ